MVGLTSELPNDVPESWFGEDAEPHEWNYRGYFNNNAQTTKFPDIPFLDDLTPGQSVGLLVTPSGELHVFFNGKYRHEIATAI